jgi:hypothetical protein
MPLKGDFADQAPASAPISHISSLSSVDKLFLGAARPIAKWALRLNGTRYRDKRPIAQHNHKMLSIRKRP